VFSMINRHKIRVLGMLGLMALIAGAAVAVLAQQSSRPEPVPTEIPVMQGQRPAPTMVELATEILPKFHGIEIRAPQDRPRLSQFTAERLGLAWRSDAASIREIELFQVKVDYPYFQRPRPVETLAWVISFEPLPGASLPSSGPAPPPGATPRGPILYTFQVVILDAHTGELLAMLGGAR
jgi:hypothetical protein